MQQPPGYPPGGYGPPGGGYGPPPGGGYGPPPAPPGGSYPPPGGGYGPPGGGYGPPPGGAFPPAGGPGFAPQPPKKDGPSIAVIILIAVIGLGVLGLGGCLTCLYVVGKGDSKSGPVAQGDPGTDPASRPTENWITSDRPFVKFLAPPGWNKTLKGDWGLFRSTDGQAVFAFTTFNQPGESTARLSNAAWALGVTDINWGNPSFGSIGQDNFKARMGEGTCNFNGPGGYIWYATVNPGESDQILLIYTVSILGNKSHKDAALTSVRSLQRR